MLRLFAIATLLCVGCGDETDCVDVDATCEPLYEPRFDEIFARTLAPRCGVPGGACHAAEGARGGLVMVEADATYGALLEGRVVPGDPGCSLLVERLASEDRGFAMPPGSPLAPAERCAIERWIADGAAR